MTTEQLYNVAVVGATGAVGKQIVRLLEQRNFPIRELKLLSSPRSAGKVVPFNGRDITVEVATPEQFDGIDIAWFSAGGSVSKTLVPEAVKRGVLCIDNTSAYRMDPEVPLIVPEVNANQIKQHKGIIANPNCSTIQMVASLKPLHDRYGISRIICSTYQAVSGAGSEAIEETVRQSRAVLNGEDVQPDLLPVSSLPVKHQMAFNVVPQIDVFADNGFTFEEMKMVNETKKILEDDTLAINVTCVRVPVLNGHSESLYVELKEEYDLSNVRELLASSPSIVVVDNPEEQQYPLAIESSGKLDVFVGRLRRDLNEPKGLNMWIVSDNLLKGASWNAVQIAEYYIANE